MTTSTPVLPGLYDMAPTIGPTDAPIVAPVPSSERRLDVLLAAVEAKANADTTGFSLAASRFILRYLDAHGATSGERVTDAAKAAGIQPTDDRHFGPVYLRLARLGVIRKAGYVARTKGARVRPGAGMGDRAMTRRIHLNGGAVLEVGDGRRRLVNPTECRVCRRKVTADGDRDHVVAVPDVDQVDATVSVVIEQCHGRVIA